MNSSHLVDERSDHVRDHLTIMSSSAISLVRLRQQERNLGSQRMIGQGYGIRGDLSGTLLDTRDPLIGEHGFCVCQVIVADTVQDEDRGPHHFSPGQRLLLVPDGEDAGIGVWDELRTRQVGWLPAEIAAWVRSSSLEAEPLVATSLWEWRDELGRLTELHVLVGPSALRMPGSPAPAKNVVPRWAWIAIACLVVAVGLVGVDVVNKIDTRVDDSDAKGLVATLDQEVATANSELTTTNQILAQTLARVEQLEQQTQGN